MKTKRSHKDNYTNLLFFLSFLLVLPFFFSLGSAADNSYLIDNNISSNYNVVGRWVQYNTEPAYSYYFNGNGSYMRFYNTTFLPSNVSISFWVYPVSNSTPGYTFSSNKNTRFSIRYDGNQSVTAQVGNPVRQILSNYTTVPLYNWTLITLTSYTLNSTSSNATLYINNVSYGSLEYNSSTLGTGVDIGRFVNSNQYFNGSISDFRIYNSTIDINSINALIINNRTFNKSLDNTSLIVNFNFNKFPTLFINGSANLTLQDIYYSFNNTFLLNTTDFINYSLKSNLIINSSSINLTLINLNLDLYSNNLSFSYFELNNLDNILILNSRISSFNNQSNSIDNTYRSSSNNLLRGRSYVLIRDSNGVIINNSEFIGLGYDGGLYSGAPLYGGITLFNTDGLIASNNSFRFNDWLFSSFDSRDILFYNNFGSNITGANDTIETFGFGFYTTYNSSIYQNNITNVRSSSGWKARDSQAIAISGISSNVYVYNNTVTNSETGIVLYNSIINTSIFNNNIQGIEGAAIKLEDNSDQSPTDTYYQLNISIFNNVIRGSGNILSDTTNSSVRPAIELDFGEGRNNTFISIYNNYVYDSFSFITSKYGSNISIFNNLLFNFSSLINYSIPESSKSIFRFNSLNNTLAYNNTLISLGSYIKYKYSIYSSNNINVSDYNYTSLIDNLLVNSTITKNLYFNNHYLNTSYKTLLSNRSNSDTIYSNRNNTFNVSLVFASLSNSLLYNKSNYLYCSDINTCDFLNYNVTVNSLDDFYILEDFNLTEGVTRQFSPLSFTSSSSTGKTITSSLSNGVNTTVQFNIGSCDMIGNIVYDPAGNGTTVIYELGDYPCTDNQVLLTLGVEPGRNELSIEYWCSSLTLAGYKLIMIIASLIIVLVFGMYVWNKGIENWEVRDFYISFAILLIVITLWTVAGQNLGGSCPVNT